MLSRILRPLLRAVLLEQRLVCTRCCVMAAVTAVDSLVSARCFVCSTANLQCKVAAV
jgi:hypothetical protein